MANKFKGIIPVQTANLSAIAAGIALVGGSFYLLGNSFYNVEAGQHAIVFSRISGVKNIVYGEGLKFKIPWFEKEIIYPTRATNITIKTDTGSKDLQMVDIRLNLIFKPNIDQLPTIYRTLGKDYANRVLPSVAKEVLKSVVAKFTAAELITMRTHVSTQIKARLVERSQEFGILLDDVSLADITFGREFREAIEAKQIAQQEAERAKFVVNRARETKREIIAKAEGEKRAALKFNEALQKDPSGNFLALRKIEAAKEIAQHISEGNNRIILDADVLLFNKLTQPADIPPPRATSKKW